jgi:hypothetical protein
MALSFPLSAAAFLSLLPVQSVRFHCVPSLAATGLSGGDVITSEVAPAMWQGTYALAPMASRQADEVEALLQALQVPGRAFYACKSNQIGPASDPRGLALAVAAVKIGSLDFTGSRLSLQGLPGAFAMRRGDLLSFEYGSGPVARALHRLEASVTANASGLTGLVSVGPHIEPGAVAGAAVTLIRPTCKAVILPGSVDYGTTSGRITTGVTFSFRQTFR